MKPLESWVNIMHLGKGEPVLTWDEKLCEEGFTKSGRSSYESSIFVKCGHFFSFETLLGVTFSMNIETHPSDFPCTTH